MGEEAPEDTTLHAKQQQEQPSASAADIGVPESSSEDGAGELTRAFHYMDISCSHTCHVCEEEWPAQNDKYPWYWAHDTDGWQWRVCYDCAWRFWHMVPETTWTASRRELWTMLVIKEIASQGSRPPQAKKIKAR